MYEIKYLPLARKDLLDITNYIAVTLKAPKAALDLLDALDNHINPEAVSLFMQSI